MLKRGVYMTYIYACISDKCMKPLSEVQKTRKYKKAIELQKLLRIEKFALDICSSGNRKKLQLEEILSTEGNIIVISDISSLGKKDEVISTYQRILESNNDLLICYFDRGGILVADPLSSVNIKFEKIVEFDLDSNLQLLSNISSNKYRVESSRVVSNDIINAYWQIEKGEKSEREVVKALNMSKTTFIKRINEYMFSDGWVDRYCIEAENNESFRESPVKLGGVSDKGIQFYSFLETFKKDGHESSYEIPVLLIFSEIESELLKKIQEYDDMRPTDEIKRLERRFNALAYHYFRQVLRHRKYLYNLKYRKDK